MASATIVITDNPDGSIHIGSEFDPPLEREEEGTAAQQVAAAMLVYILDDSDAVEFEKESN